jgi:hypothetical protein
VLEFFETSGRNLLLAEAAAGVGHHVALSIVGIDRTDNGYFRAKVAQEKLILTSGVPYTIIRATQFLEFLGGIADSSADGNIVSHPPWVYMPNAADFAMGFHLVKRCAGAKGSERKRLKARSNMRGKNCSCQKCMPGITQTIGLRRRS